jgi:hypothetical protein
VMIRHIRSCLMIGHSQFCRAGYPAFVGMPSRDCLVPVPDGSDYVCLQDERIELCADCFVARGAGHDDASVCVCREGVSLDGCKREAGHD